MLHITPSICEARLLNQVGKEYRFLYLHRHNFATFPRSVPSQKATECKISKSQHRNISPISHFGDLSDDGLLIKHLLDIPALANVAIGKINQTNPMVVRGIDSAPETNLGWDP
jgi:hypothetical protein